MSEDSKNNDDDSTKNKKPLPEACKPFSYRNYRPNELNNSNSGQQNYNNQNNWRRNYNDNQRVTRNYRLNERNNNQDNSVQVPKQASYHIQKFWIQISKRVLHTAKGKFELKDDEQSLWFDTWKAAAAGASGPIKALPIAYLKLPSTSNFSPAPLTILSVFIRIAEEIKAAKPKRHEEFSTVNTLEEMLDIINLRLVNQVKQGFPKECVEQLIEQTNQFDQIFFQAVTNSLSLYVKDTDRLARLLMRRNEIESFIKQIRVSLTVVGHNKDVQRFKTVPWLGWQQRPTLNWLMSGAWHQNCSLKAIYETNQEYADTLLRVWTLLTFYWGSGAVWPKCSFKQRKEDANACGEPLLAHFTKGSKVCRKNGCERVSEWKCARYNHDSICEECLLKNQGTLIGSSSQWASTDIYDAVIEREISRREESVYLLRNIECRKPFRIVPNWKTSKLKISEIIEHILN